MRHQFTAEERQRGGKTRASQDSFTEMCINGYEALQFKNPYAWAWVYQNKVAPHMKRKEAAKTACERSVMQQGQLEQHIGRRRPMK